MSYSFGHKCCHIKKFCQEKFLSRKMFAIKYICYEIFLSWDFYHKSFVMKNFVIEIYNRNCCHKFSSHNCFWYRYFCHNCFLSQKNFVINEFLSTQIFIFNLFYCWIKKKKIFKNSLSLKKFNRKNFCHLSIFYCSSYH